MHQSPALVAGDTGTVLRVTVRNQQSKGRLDLTGATVRLIWRIDGGAKQTRVMTLVDAPSGVASYQFATGELTAIAYGSTLTAEVEVTDAGGAILTQLQLLDFKVRAKL